MSQLSSLAEVVAAMEKVDPSNIQEVAERLKSSNHLHPVAKPAAPTLVPAAVAGAATAGSAAPRAALPASAGGIVGSAHVQPQIQDHGYLRTAQQTTAQPQQPQQPAQSAPHAVHHSSSGSYVSDADAKRQKRLQRNRISAKLWRNKKRARMEELETAVAQFGRVHAEIVRHVQQVSQQNRALRDLIASTQNRELTERADEVMRAHAVDLKALSQLLSSALASSVSPDSASPMCVSPPVSQASLPTISLGPPAALHTGPFTAPAALPPPPPPPSALLHNLSLAGPLGPLTALAAMTSTPTAPAAAGGAAGSASVAAAPCADPHAGLASLAQLAAQAHGVLQQAVSAQRGA